jgi:RNA polymerase sigma factor for flagellar operon FliA
VEQAERARLVESHLELARKAAAMIFPRVRDHIEFDELVALGNIGLADAASKFDPARGASFSTYAWYRVQGAIVDGLRKQSNLPRRVWAKLIALRAAGEYLENRAERDAGAAQKGTPPAQSADALAAIKSAMSAIRTMYMTSLEGMREAGFDAVDGTPGADTRLDTGRLTGKLRDALASLPDRERELMTKHYYEGKNLLEAGAELGISKSWASRLHSQAVERLRGLVDAEIS